MRRGGRGERKRETLRKRARVIKRKRQDESERKREGEGEPWLPAPCRGPAAFRPPRAARRAFPRSSSIDAHLSTDGAVCCDGVLHKYGRPSPPAPASTQSHSTPPQIAAEECSTSQITENNTARTWQGKRIFIY